MNLSYPLTISYSAVTFKPGQRTDGCVFEDKAATYRGMTALQYIFFLTEMSSLTTEMFINGASVWTKDDGHVHTIEGLDDIGVDRWSKFYSKRQRMIMELSR